MCNVFTKIGGGIVYYIFSFKLQSYLMYHNEPLIFETAGAAHRFLRDHLHTDLRNVNPCIVVKRGERK